MTEGPAKPIIPPRPALPPRALRRKLAREARQQARRDKTEQKHQRLQLRHQLRRSKDVAVFHGHYVVSGDDLGELFTDEERLEDPVLFRHRIIHGVTLTVLVALVITGVVLAVMVSRGDLQLPVPASQTSPKPSCPTAKFNYPANKDVHVEVYNSTRREGMAGSVAAELKKRGFNVDLVANKTTDYAGTAVIVSGPAGQSAAFNLQRNFPGTDYVQDARTDATVDVYLTSDFKDLVPAAQVDQTPGVLSCPRFSPSPVPTGPSGAPAGPTTAAP